MNTREIAAEYRLSHWVQIMRERQESGMSIKSFCQHIGCHENVYYYWQRKLREAACSGLSAKEPPQEKAPAPIGWSRLETVEPLTSEGAGLTIEINGCRVNATAGSDPGLLAQVCRMLKAL